MSDGPLPPDWEATTDPSSGNTYYYNTKTNAVSWERPRPAVPPPPGGAPSGGPPPDDLLGFDAPGRRGEYLVAVYGREERANFLAIAEAKPRPERYADDDAGKKAYRKDYKAWHARESSRKKDLAAYEAEVGALTVACDDPENIAQGVRLAEQHFERRQKTAAKEERIAVLEEEFKATEEDPHRAHELAVNAERRARDGAEREARKAPEKPAKRLREGRADGVGYWTANEHRLFLEGIALSGSGGDREANAKVHYKISDHVVSRTPTQVRTHMQKYLERTKDERAAAAQTAERERAAAERERAAAERVRAAEDYRTLHAVLKEELPKARRARPPAPPNLAAPARPCRYSCRGCSQPRSRPQVEEARAAFALVVEELTSRAQGGAKPSEVHVQIENARRELWNGHQYRVPAVIKKLEPAMLKLNTLSGESARLHLELPPPTTDEVIALQHARKLCGAARRLTATAKSLSWRMRYMACDECSKCRNKQWPFGHGTRACGCYEWVQCPA